MKRYISAVLIPCLLLQFFGCYSFQPLETGENINKYLNSNEKIKFIVNDREDLISKGNDCELITNQKFILYGKGIQWDKKTKQSIIFQGAIEQNTVDSVKSLSIESKDYIICWLKDSTRISFPNENLAFNSDLNPDSMYWLISKTELPKLISENNISGFEMEKINLFNTISLALLGLAYISVLVYFMSGAYKKI